MKKLLYTLFLLCGFAPFASGQINYSITPNPASGSGPDSLGDFEVHSEIHNLTGDTLKLHWDRIVISITPGCETAVCDAITCYARTVSSRNFKLYPHITRPFTVHFYNNGAHCEGIVHIRVTNLNNAADSVNVVFLYNQNTDAKDLPSPDVRLYPNPVSTFFALENAENVAAIRVFNQEGREVARLESNPENRYLLPHQPAGLYYLALEDKNGRAFQALELIKQ